MKTSSQCWAAVGLIVLAALFWVVGGEVGFSADRYPAWFYSLAGWMFASGPPVAIAGGLWLALVAIKTLFSVPPLPPPDR